MNSNDYWQQFISCGSIDSYLKYKEEINKEIEENNDTKPVYN